MAETGRISRANLSQQIYVSIREDLINGRYEPGRRLRSAELSDELGVSITPVREAIFRLVSGGALVMQASTSVHVRTLKVDELGQIRLMRHLLEGEAAFHVSSDTQIYEVRRQPVLRGVAQRSGSGGRADRQESERAPRRRGRPGAGFGLIRPSGLPRDRAACSCGP